jgi:UPF0271 protein
VRIDLNADVGESSSDHAVGDDAGMMKWITSANIAAGFHAGGPSTLRETIRLAKSAGVAVGAHPGFPDREGFGRRDMHLGPGEAEDVVLYQLAAVAGVAAAEGVRMAHVKPHGALYNMAARDPRLAAAVARAVSSVDRSLILLCPPDSALMRAALEQGLAAAAEGFVDRRYAPDGSLVPRSEPGAVITDPDQVVAGGVRMAREGRFRTLCVHGDTPGAVTLAARLHAALAAAGLDVRALSA